MADDTDEARVLAWIDGELNPAEAADMAERAARDPELAALADRHRRLKQRFANAFAPLAEVREPAPVISLAEVRAARARAQRPPSIAKRWAWPTAIAASLLVAILIGQGGLNRLGGPDPLAPAITTALDTQFSGDPGPIRIALSFRDRQGAFCRSFTGADLSGIACRDGAGWALRHRTDGKAAADYRMAGTDTATMAAVDTMIAGEPLDRTAEANGIRKGWR